MKTNETIKGIEKKRNWKILQHRFTNPVTCQTEIDYRPTISLRKNPPAFPLHWIFSSIIKKFSLWMNKWRKIDFFQKYIWTTFHSMGENFTMHWSKNQVCVRAKFFGEKIGRSKDGFFMVKSHTPATQFPYKYSIPTKHKNFSQT